MESQMAHPHGHAHDQDPYKARDPHLAEDEDQGHEKKSMMNRMKAKARKMKDTITNHGHGHNHDHDHNVDHTPDDHDLDEEDEMVEDPEVHSAPIHESTTVMSSTTPMSTPVTSFSHGISETKETDPSKTFVPGTESKVNLERPKGGLEEDPHPPKWDTPHTHPPSNYQTKATDPTGTGNEEIGVTPILGSFDKMKIHEESEPKSLQNPTNVGYSSTGSHDQFSPDQPDKPIITPQHPQTLQEDMDSTVEPPGTQSTLTKKLSSAKASFADKAISVKNVVASKLGYGERDQTSGVHDQTSSGNGDGYGKKIAATVTEKATPVYEKVAEAETTVVSKIQGTTAARSENEPANSDAAAAAAAPKGQNKGVSVKDYFAEKLRPGDGDRALSEVISDTLHKRNKQEAAEIRPVGKVTESEEVARRLGTGDEISDEKEQSGYVDRAGEKSVVDKVKGTVSSWLGYGGDQSRSSQQQSSGDTFSQGEVGHDKMQGKEERRLQESSN